MAISKKSEFGDFQTPIELTEKIVKLVELNFPHPDIIIEPTCGLGNFIKSCKLTWKNKCAYYGFDINSQYIDACNATIKDDNKCHFEVADFFTKNWNDSIVPHKNKQILLIGNPPWITNAALGVHNSKNLPKKNNFQGLKGFSAKTGKANFDIAEWILIKLMENLQNTHACMAMLCKTATARKVLKHAWISHWNVHNTSIHLIDAKKHFNVSVDACLLIVFIKPKGKSSEATIYGDLSYKKETSKFGLIGNEIISDIDNYNKYKHIDGLSYYTWRSGIKHDAAKVMELTMKNGKLINGFKEEVHIEDDYLHPLLKSSDLGNNRLTPRKFVIVTQRKVGDSTDSIKTKAPKTWAYLQNYSSKLTNRKSSIYNNRPMFSIFGIGNYSFSPWKVAISGFYKNITFSPIGNINQKSIMVDDTCYFIPCASKEEAELISSLLNSKECINFMKSLIFFDAKRPINIDILKRVDIKKIANFVNKSEEVMKYLPYAQQFTSPQQLMIFENKPKYRSG